MCKIAYLDDPRLHLPDPLRDDRILVYYRRKKTGTFRESDYYIWERRYMEKLVNHKYIHENQGSLLMNLDFYQFIELIDINPDPGCPFIHSMSEPRSEEDLEDEVMHNWIEHFNLRFHQLHASGHANRQELISMINRINPQSVFPVHTENPHLHQACQAPVCMVEQGKRYNLTRR